MRGWEKDQTPRLHLCSHPLGREKHQQPLLNFGMFFDAVNVYVIPPMMGTLANIVSNFP